MISVVLWCSFYVVAFITAVPILAGLVETIAGGLRWLFRTKRWRDSRRKIMHRQGWDA